jgi:hypothetical protein
VVLSKRERYVAIATVAAVGILALDRFALDPLMASKTRLDTQVAKCQQNFDKARRLFANSRRKGHLWAEMQNNGLRRRDAAEAESQVLNSIREWAQDAGMSLSSVKPERTEKEKDFAKSTFRATGTGGMSQISRFIWHLETATIPLRVSDVQINSRKEGTDDLTVQLGISTIYLPHEVEKDAAGPVPSSREVQP